MAGHSASDIDRRIATRVQAARRAVGHTQRQVGAALGITAAQLQKYESGQNRISGGMLQLMAEQFGVPIASFFDAPCEVLQRGEAA